MTAPRTPAGLGPAGGRLFRSVIRDFDLTQAELVILTAAAHTADTCADLQTIVDKEGPILTGEHGPRPHPALVELRQERITLARLVVAMRIPDDVADQAGRPQRRGLRGVYGVRDLA